MISTCGVEEEVQDHKDQVQNEEVEVEVVRLKSKLVVEVSCCARAPCGRRAFWWQAAAVSQAPELSSRGRGARQDD